MLRERKTRGQSFSEYALIFGLVVGAIVAVQTYVKRGLQAKIADVANAVSDAGVGVPLGPGVTLGDTRQWEPGYMHSSYTSSQDTDLEETMSGGSISRTQTEGSQRSGSQTIDAPPVR